MKILAIDTTTSRLSIALGDEKKTWQEININAQRNHSELLVPTVKEILKNNQLELKNLTNLAVATGPGSFTGIRIGLSFVRTFAQTLNIPVIGISTLDGLAFIETSQDIVCPILDALREEVYTGFYKSGKRITDLRIVGIKNLFKEISQKGNSVFFLGEAVDIYEDMIKTILGNKAEIAPKPPHQLESSRFVGHTNWCGGKSSRYVSASRLVRIAVEKFKEKKGWKYEDVKPIYIRRPPVYKKK